MRRRLVRARTRALPLVVAIACGALAFGMVPVNIAPANAEVHSEPPPDVLEEATTMLDALPTTDFAPVALPEPFDSSAPTIFLAQDLNPTDLYITKLVGDEYVFEAVGSTAGFAYNAIGYNTVDDYIYGVRKRTTSQTNESLTNELVRIGKGGVVESLDQVANLPVKYNGTVRDYNQGTFGTGADAETLYVRRGIPDRWLYAIDVTTQQATQIPLDAEVPNVADIVFLHGFVWGFHSDGKAYRIDPQNGHVDVFSTGIARLYTPSSPFGAQWVYGNGNVGISRNGDGTVFQIEVPDATTSQPTFRLVSETEGPPSTNNDGTYFAGIPVDLSIAKTGTATYSIGLPDQRIHFEITVTNENGDDSGNPARGTSSGFTVTDTLPDSLSDIVIDDDAGGDCNLTQQTVTCTFGELVPQGTRTIKISAVVSAGATTDIRNTASVLGNEEEPVGDEFAMNNDDSHVITAAGTVAYVDLVKRLQWATVDTVPVDLTFTGTIVCTEQGTMNWTATVPEGETEAVATITRDVADPEAPPASGHGIALWAGDTCEMFEDPQPGLPENYAFWGDPTITSDEFTAETMKFETKGGEIVAIDSLSTIAWSMTLPATGGTGTWWVWVSGGGFVAAGFVSVAALLWTAVRRRVCNL